MDKQEAIKALLKLGELPTQEKIDRMTGKVKTETVVLQKPIEKPAKSFIEHDSSVNILRNYDYKQKKVDITDFSTFFRDRYNFMKNILVNRPSMEGAVSISGLTMPVENVAVIGMVSEINKLPTGTLKITIEDLTGRLDLIISTKNPELMKQASYLALDEVLAFKGNFMRKVLFVNEIVWPDIPNEPRPKSPDEAYAVFSSDIHVGSKMFLEKNFMKFISWLQGKYGDSKMQDIAKKTKYVFVLGDLVDGVGIYPGQKKELTHSDIYQQYDVIAKYLSMIPDDKHIVIIPGNHDAVRLVEPQPPLYKDLAAPLYELPNVINVSNPSLIQIHKHDDFQGMKVLAYHGYSYDYFVDKIEALRNAGGYDRPDKIMEFLLKRRHLAPSYGSTLAMPMSDDNNLIRERPDVIASGHIHKAGIASYRNVLMLSSSCWQAKTPFQERVGHNPDPCKIPIISLKEGKANMLEFG